MTYRELIYMVLDLSKLSSDDMTINEEHVMFLLDKVRAALLWQKYSNAKLEVPESNYQRLCLKLEPSDGHALLGACAGETYVRSVNTIPIPMKIGNVAVYPTDYYKGIHINYVARERMRYVGHNEILRNIIYCSIAPDGHMYFKSNNPQFQYLASVQFTAVFESPSEAGKMDCDAACDPLDRTFALEETLAQLLIDNLVNEILGAAHRPADTENTAADDLANLASYLRMNTKSQLRKELEA